MELQIPEGWRNIVAQILRRQRGTVLIRRRARQDWSDMFPGAFDFELNEALAAAVDNRTLTGRKVFDMEEPGEVYEFIFWHDRRKVYAKICLQQSDLVVIVY